MAKNVRVRKTAQQFRGEVLAESRQACSLCIQFGSGDLRRSTKSNDASDILRGRPQAAFLAAAEHYRCEFHAIAYVKRADPLRTVELMSGKREQVDLKTVYIQGN